ncbi:prepilin-type N-terminal cleavage/methylation domain-containing protein [Thermodesulfitimonas autotrophica]|uniref:Prepilin-type N-terminal cleavage/methylation domain-containing protein n=1 Tax=Thermodesulfitimonas autotrophica TaxID=1894989 RepID=A0A3N5BTP2_9THEO|nr:type II secretion system protein [Thermodesulfitimonas autotrophica]RPF49225.1 prepilin-type N-terminal cleavage/methylation domain-containing protein [Thermodesulfitimonas autotrophica]
MKPWWRGECGMTLVEVLVAAVILGIMATGIFTAYDVSKRLAETARQETKAAGLAQEKLEELRAVDYSALSTVPNPADPPADFVPTVAGFTYRVVVVPNVTTTTKTVTISVYYRVRAAERELSLTMERVAP